jgi:aldehyde dehydrogenase (NAD+)
MQDEIFGPILPILPYSDFDTIHKVISNYEKPLACYVFSNNHSFAQKIIQKYSFGGGCINDTMMHFANKRLPFGGVGHSGIGAYHGQRSFDLLSHHKSVMKKSNWLEIPLRYAPYDKKFNFVRKLLKYI